MTKGKTNIFYAGLLLFLLLAGSKIYAQIEVIKPDDPQDKVFWYDSLSADVPFSVVERKIQDSVLNSLKKDEAFWYANTVPAPKKPISQKKGSSLQWLRAKWVRVLLWILILVSFVAVMAWYLSTLHINLFRKPSAPLNNASDAAFAEDIFSISFPDEIAKAAQLGQYRLAIRLYYLQTLRILSDKGHIHYKQDRTNSAYVAQLYRTHLYKDFSRLTRNFEYTWYGGFAVSPVMFDALQKDFKTFQSHLPE